ncbi:MAG: RagB/SusD family nutrient uptake outer membrane protein [Gemmatimonadota bacterium]
MRIALIPTLGLALALAGCHDLLDTNPTNQLPSDKAITTAAGARAALAGAYDGLQSLSYYGGDYLIFNDLYADNAQHIGTSNSYADAGGRSILADNGVVSSNWASIYVTISRANNLIQKVPAVADLDETEKNEILGEAHFIRALCFHNLVKVWGDVPMPLIPPTTLDEASAITRTPVADVYTQILDDLSQAATLITNTDVINHANVGAVHALLARVYLYQANYAAAGAEADSVTALGYLLATNYGDMFQPGSATTTEDIFNLSFTAIDYTNLGYYYISVDNGGAGEVAPSGNIDSAFTASDVRYAWDINTETDPPEGIKWPTTFGTEWFRVFRYSEIVLIKAEVLARANQLGAAVDEYNLIRERAGLPDHVLGTDVTSQQDVLDAIDHERRLEMAFEGDRFPDLVRTGRATTVLGIPAFRTLFPIPQSEIDVAPGITQNTGY